MVRTLIIALILQTINVDAFKKFKTVSNIPEDGRLNFTGLAIKYGFPKVEEHDVITEDGYILKLFHIPGDRTRPLLMMHGFLDSSDTYILRGNISMAIALARKGYDIWAGNFRGNRYSRRHVKLNPDTSTAFWDFSVHELGYKDLPAFIDYVLKITGQQKLQAIGHSEGNNVFYVLGSMRPEYNNKVKLLVALAPVCYLHHVEFPANLVLEFGDFANNMLQLFGFEEFIGYSSLIKEFWDALCTQGNVGYQLCENILLGQLMGPDPQEMEVEFFPVTVGHLPAGTSRKNYHHFVQTYKRKTFSQYDYGFIENLIVYGSVVPPEYNLRAVTMPVSLFVSKGDRLAPIKDVALLKASLPNVVDYFLVKSPIWGHLNYMWARNAHKYVYPHLFEVLEKYN